MHARTYIASIALLFLIILVGAPKISNATVEEAPGAPTTGLFTGLLWSDNIYDQNNIQDGGTYSVTLNKQGYADSIRRWNTIFYAYGEAVPFKF